MLFVSQPRKDASASARFNGFGSNGPARPSTRYATPFPFGKPGQDPSSLSGYGQILSPAMGAPINKSPSPSPLTSPAGEAKYPVQSPFSSPTSVQSASCKSTTRECIQAASVFSGAMAKRQNSSKRLILMNGPNFAHLIV